MKMVGDVKQYGQSTDRMYFREDSTVAYKIWISPLFLSTFLAFFSPFPSPVPFHQLVTGALGAASMALSCTERRLCERAEGRVMGPRGPLHPTAGPAPPRTFPLSPGRVCKRGRTPPVSRSSLDAPALPVSVSTLSLNGWLPELP